MTVEAPSDSRTFVWCTYRDWSFHVLEGLLDVPGWTCALIVTTPDCRYKMAGFEEKGIKILRVNPTNAFYEDGEAYKAISALKSSVVFHYGWSWLVPECALSVCMNVTLHPGKLPKDRGGSPIQNQIRNGETWTYANIIELVAGLDEGPIYLRERISLEGDDVDSVWARMTATGTVLSRKLLLGLVNNTITSTRQDNQIAPTTYKRVRPEDARLHPTQQDAQNVYNIIRAHNESDPNTYVEKAFVKIGKHRIVIHRASLEKPNLPACSRTWDLSSNSYDAETLYEMAHETNNKLASTFIVAADAQPVYLTRFFVSYE